MKSFLQRHSIKFTLHTLASVLFFSIFFLIGLTLFLFFSRQQLEGKVFRGVYLNSTNISEFDSAQLEKLLLSYQDILDRKSVTLDYHGKLATYSGELLKLRIPSNTVKNSAFAIGREGSILSQYLTTAGSIFQRQKTIIRLIPSYDVATIAAYLDDLAKIHDTPPIDARFKMENDKVVDFAIHTDGHAVDKEKSLKQLENSFVSFIDLDTQTDHLTITIEDKISKPSFFLSSTNSLGIVELVGKGESNYSHSSAERIHNLSLGSTKIHGTLIPPNSVFSFNQALGDISAATGYKQAYIISQGRTQLGDGGGICQTSSTFFRTALDAGLPIIERKAHAYRVRYYENDSDPGFDATVYAPSPDLKVKNDTPAHLLLWVENDKKNMKLTYYLYGKKDGRKAVIANYKKWGASPPAATIYQDDPTLKRGVKKQVDFPVGGLNTSFDYTVTKGNEIVFQKTFVSNFRPWPAVYLVGTMD